MNFFFFFLKKKEKKKIVYINFQSIRFEKKETLFVVS